MFVDDLNTNSIHVLSVILFKMMPYFVIKINVNETDAPHYRFMLHNSAWKQKHECLLCLSSIGWTLERRCNGWAEYQGMYKQTL